jgi:hypothetical protein
MGDFSPAIIQRGPASPHFLSHNLRELWNEDSPRCVRICVWKEISLLVTDQEVAALFRYDLDPAGEKSESTLVTIRPAGATGELVLSQLEQSADRLATILEKGNRLQKTYIWRIENP